MSRAGRLVEPVPLGPSRPSRPALGCVSSRNSAQVAAAPPPRFACACAPRLLGVELMRGGLVKAGPCPWSHATSSPHTAATQRLGLERGASLYQTERWQRLGRGASLYQTERWQRLGRGALRSVRAHAGEACGVRWRMGRAGLAGEGTSGWRAAAGDVTEDAAAAAAASSAAVAATRSTPCAGAAITGTAGCGHGWGASCEVQGKV